MIADLDPLTTYDLDVLAASALGFMQPAPGVGHNSGNTTPMAEDDLPPWASPSVLSFEEMAALNSGPNRLTHQINTLIAAIADPRLGDVSIPRLLIVAVIKYLNRETGTAYPGLRRLAEDIYRELNRLPPKTAEQVLKNAVTLVRQCGYLLTKKAAPPGGGRAVANFAVGFPDPEARRQAVPAYEEWLAKEAAKEAARRGTKGARSGNPPGYVRSQVTHPVTSAQVTQMGYVRPAEVTHTQGAEVTHTGDRSLLLNREDSKPEDSGADAPWGVGEEKGFPGGAPHQVGAPSDRAAPASKGTPCKSLFSEPDDEAPAVEMSPACWKALAAYNEAAAEHHFTPCRSPTDAQAKRLAKRLAGIGGLGRFKLALSALPLDDFLMGRVSGKAGGRPYRLNLDGLMRTTDANGNPRDVLAKLLELADARDAGGCAGHNDIEAELHAIKTGKDGPALLKSLGEARLREIAANAVKAREGIA